MKLKVMAFLLICIGMDVAISQNNGANDSWSGRYRMEPLGKQLEKKHPNQFYTIRKVDDLKKDDVAGRFESDLERWSIIQDADTLKDDEQLRRFLVNDDDDENEYEQFGWAGLYKNGTMKCMDGGNLFICQTTPKTKVTIGEDESFITNSGIFVVVLHYGVFEFYKEPDQN